MGSRKYVFPVLIVVLIGDVMALMFYPMLNMAPKELPFAVLSLDEGAETPQGEINAGAMMADTLVNAEVPEGEDAAPIKWELFESQQELDQALANNELFGALTIPADFTERQAMAQAGAGDVPSVDVVLDNAKSPIAATQMQQSLGEVFAEMNIPANIEIINTGDSDAAASSPLAGMMSQQIGVMPLMMMSLAGSIVLTRIFPKKNAASTGGRFAALGKQLGYAGVLSLLAAVTAVVLLNTLVGASAPFWTTTVFLWLASFAVMSLFIGSFNISTLLGVLVVVFALLCGMLTAVLPAELLPAFWADWIYPWSPQHFIGDGIRDILYRGAGLWPRGAGGLLALGGIGLALAGLSALISGRSKGSAPERSDEPQSAPSLA